MILYQKILLWRIHLCVFYKNTFIGKFYEINGKYLFINKAAKMAARFDFLPLPSKNCLHGIERLIFHLQ